MALTPKQIAELLKLRALGWSQAEIAEQLKTSQQVIGYQLKKLKKQSKIYINNFSWYTFIYNYFYELLSSFFQKY